MATQYWITGTAGDWSTVADWSLGVVPTPTIDAVINNSNAVTVNGTAVAQSLTLNNSTLTASGTLTLGTSLTLDNSAQFILSGGTLSAQSITTDNYGLISGNGTISGGVDGNVWIYANGGTLKVEGSLAGDTSRVSIYSDATLELSNGTDRSAYFEGYPGTLKLDAPAAFTGEINQVAVGDTIDFSGIVASSATYSGTTLTISESSGQQLTYYVAGGIAGDTLTVASDNNDGTLVYWVPPADSWKTGTAGDWSQAADWQSGVVPGSTDNPIINDSSALTVNGTAVANSLTLNNSTLNVGGTLTLGTSLTLDGAAQLKLSGGMLLAQSIAADNGTNGSLYGYGTVSGAIGGEVFITAAGGTLKIESSFAANFAPDESSFFINPGATLELSNGTAASAYFEGNTGKLKLDAPAAFTGSVNQIVAGDTIDLAGITASSATYNGTTLTINENSGYQLTYNVSGTLAGDFVQVASDNSGGTLITWVQSPESWITGTAGDWSTAADWATGVVPTTTDDAVITNSYPVTVNGTAVADSLILNNSDLTVGGSLNLGTSLTLDNNAYLNINGGSFSAQSIDSDNGTYGYVYDYGTADCTLSSDVIGNVSFIVNGHTLKIEGSLTGDQGGFYIYYGTLELSTETSQWVRFDGSPATLKLDAPTKFTGQIQNIVIGDTVDLFGVTASSASYNGTTLTINETNGQQLTYNNVSGTLAGDFVNVASDNNGGTLVYWTSTPSLTVASISATTDNKATDVNAGHLVTITMTTSEAVTVTGTPTLQLNDNEVATYTTGSGTDTLTFTYTVQPGDNVADLQVTGLNLPSGATIQNAGNNLSGGVTGNLGIQIDTVGPIEQYLVATVDNHATNVTTEHTITLILTTSEPVTVTGAPTLQLNDNEVATYASGSGGNALIFTYTVKAADSTSDLQVTGLNLPAGATVQDAAGNSLAAVTGDLFLQINATTTPPESWIAGTSGDWFSTANWLSGVVPSSTDDVFININNNSNVVTVNGTAVAHSLTLYNESMVTVSGTLTLGTSLTVDSPAAGLELNGGTLSAQAITLDGGGLFGYGTVNGAVSGDADITASGGTLTVQGSLAGDTGTFNINSGATLELSSGTAEPVYFATNTAGNPATLKLDTPTAFTGSINNIAVGDMVDLAGITASSVSYDGTTLTINETNGQHLTYHVSGDSVYNASGGLATDTVLAASDDSGGTLLLFANPLPTQATTIQQEIVGLYAAVYNRAADSFGMQYWVNVVAQQADALGITYSAAATTPISPNDAALLGQLFVATQSAYFNQTYGNLNDTDFVNALYFNIGGQNAETPSAIAYWVNIIQNEEASGQSVQNARAAVVGQFVHDLIDVNLAQWTTILTPSELESTILRQAVVDNKLAVSLAYVNASAGLGGSILNAHAVGDAGFQAEVRALSGVAIDPFTATVQITGIIQAVADHNLADIQPVS